MKILVLIFLFIFSVSGLQYLMVYSAQAGSQNTILNQRPTQSKLSSTPSPHLVMFLHPGCSCSKASLTELSKLMSETPELTAQIVFMKSKKLELLFNQNPLVEKAKLISRANIVYDENGDESRLFEAETSGLTHLYINSNLVFNGGLTMARGHEGESAGKAAILSHLKGHKADSKTLVFGCDIFGKLKTLTLAGINVVK